MKKQILKRVFVLFFVAVLCLFVGCTPDDSLSSSVEELPKNYYATDVLNGRDLALIKNATSNYQIVIPKESVTGEEYASNYLADVIQKATGVHIPTVKEDAVASFDEKAYFIYVGDTKFVEQAGLKAEKESVGTNGFLLSLQGNSVIICGANAVGNVNGVQEFLSYVLDYEIYAIDEIYFNKGKNVKMVDFGTQVVSPSIKYNVPGARQVMSVEETVQFKSVDWMEGWVSLDGQIWDTVLNVHSIQTVVPQEKYSQWWNNGQLCYSNEEALDFVANVVVERIHATPSTVRYFQLGNVDSSFSCNCNECTRISINNGGMGGAYVIWLNKVAKKVESILSQQGVIDREWYVMGLMYLAYEVAPVTFDKETKKVTPLNEDVICGEHVGVQFCPVNACFAHAIDDESCPYNVENIAEQNLYGWSALTEEYFLWTYEGEFWDMHFFFDDFGSLKQNAMLFDKVGVDGVFWQCADNYTSPFGALRTYLLSKLSWDSTLSYTELFDDFFLHYYKEAGPYMREYYDLIRARMHAIGKDLNGSGCQICMSSAGVYYNTGLWSFNLLKSFEKVVKKAYEAIENAGYNEAQKETLFMRIRADEFFITHFFVKDAYKSYFTESEYEKMYEKWVQDNKYFNNFNNENNLPF